MTIKINFNITNHKKLLGIVKWLKEIGLIESFQLEPKEEQQPVKETDRFIAEMIKKGEENFTKGNVYTQAEVEQKMKVWMDSKK